MLRSLGCSRLILLVMVLALASQIGISQNAAVPKEDADAGKSPEPSTTEVRTGRVPSVSPEYRVGESDTLQITVWKSPDLSKTVVVRPDGMIALPLIGDLKVIGMTSGEIQELVTSKLKDYVVSPRVLVEITEIRSRRVFITGEIVRPGLYPLGGQTTVLQLIAQAGGLTPFAKRKSIVILRQENGKQTRFPFNYSDVVHGRSPQQNIPLAPGDTVVVP
jgi:polysaccharide export outer membrane protein